MVQIPISPKQDFLARVSAAAPVKAVSELIWNGLDAKATEVDVVFKTNGLDELDEIVVRDNGTGIDASNVKVLFGSIGESWKKNTTRHAGRALHGKNGEGRFKAFALGSLIKWETIFEDGNKTQKYTITGRANPCSFEYSDPENCADKTSTTVTVYNLKEKGLGVLHTDKTPFEFARIFALYLSKNPDVKLRINGTALCPSDFFNVVFQHTLHPFRDSRGKEYQVQIEILDWEQSVERGISLCDSAGIELHSLDAKLRAKGLNFTIQLKCDYFAELAKENRLILEDLDPDVGKIVAEARECARGYFRERKAEEQASIVARWKSDEIYPYEEKRDLTPVELAERQVFDIIGVNVEDYLPSFDEADKAQKKFTFKLLAQAITNNPESLQTIITDVLDLKKEDQDDLADLLKKTDLTNIIRSAKTVANRLDFITGLKNLLFDKETKKTLLERDQLHKILQKESWIFDENFALTVSEATLEDVLKLHLEKLGRRCDEDVEVTREDGSHGRVDLMFSLSNQPRIGQTDHLIVELKRPSKKIDTEVLSQIESYAFAVSEDPHFEKTSTHWKFIVVSNDMDDYAKKRAHQANRPVGLTYVDDNNRIEVWALTWTDVLHDAEARLQFINKSLSYRADHDSAKAYLTKKYEQYIPKAKVEADKKEVAAEGGDNDGRAGKSSGMEFSLLHTSDGESLS